MGLRSISMRWQMDCREPLHFYWWECDCKEEPTRLIACSICGGDGGSFEGGNERWVRCVACDGKGKFEAELEPITMEDLDDQ